MVEVNNFQLLDELKKMVTEDLKDGETVDDLSECLHTTIVTELSFKICTDCGKEVEKDINEFSDRITKMTSEARTYK